MVRRTFLCESVRSLILDAEDRLNKATDDLKRVTEHIEQEKAINKEVQRRQVKRRVVERE